MAKSRARYLAELLTSEGLVQSTLSALAGADGVIDLDVLPTIPNSQLEHSSVSLAGHTLSLGGTLTLDTADIGEHESYLYYTNARARAAVSASGSLSYDSDTGIFSFTERTDSEVRGLVSASGSLSYDSDTGIFSFTERTDSEVRGLVSASGSLSYDSDTGIFSFTERTDSEVRGLVSASGSLSYDSATGIFSYTTPTTIASLSNHSTDGLSEGSTNLYFTNARARAAISVSGAGSYDSGTGVITITGGVTSVNTQTGAVTLTTDNIAEGSTNLYYTSARANTDFDTRLATKSTTNLSEGTNLYYTDARVGSYLTSNSYATQSYVGTQIANLVDSAPATLDTLNELAAALGDDPNFATTVTNSIAGKVAKTGDTMTGTLTVPEIKGGGGEVAFSRSAITTTTSTGETRLFSWSGNEGFVEFTLTNAGFYWHITANATDGILTVDSNYDGSSLQFDAVAVKYVSSEDRTYLVIVVYENTTWNYVIHSRTSKNVGSSLTKYTSTGSVGGVYISYPTAYIPSGTVYAHRTNESARFETLSVGSISGGSLLKTNTNFGGDVSGTYNAIVVTNNSHEHSQLYENSTINYGASYLQWTDLSGQSGTGANGSTPQNPTNDWYHHIIANHANNGGYYYDLSLPFHQDDLYFRRVTNGSQGSFQKVWHGGNDGSGSGLDADLLDGQQGSYYAPISSLGSYLPLSGGVMTGSIKNNTDGAVIIESNASEANNWLWKEAVKQWGIYYFNKGSESGATVGGYTTVGAEVFFTGSVGNGPAMPSTWTGYQSGSVLNVMLSPYNGYIYSSSTVYAASSMVVGGNTVWHAGNDGSGSGLDADLLDGYQLDGATSVATRIFNNKGQLHTTYTDFNTVMTPGPNYLQAGNNGPHAGQFYGFMFGLGSDYATSTGTSGHYASQMYYPRASQGGSPYLYFRDMESGAWGSWRKVYAGYADSAGSASSAGNADTLDGIDSSSFLRSDTNDTASGQYTFTKTDDHAIRVGTIRGTAVGDQPGEFIQLYERVHIGSPNGWGNGATTGAPSYGLSVYGGANLATHTGTVTIGGNTAWHAGNDGSGSGLDADTVDGLDSTDLMMATTSRKWTGLSSDGAQARRWHVMRLYVCPAHWDGNHQNMKLFLHEETFESSYVEYHLWSDYNGGNQNTAMQLYVKDIGGYDHGRYKVVVGSPVSAGWDYAGQPTYYYDIYVDVAYYKTVTLYAHMRGHGYTTTPPTSGAAETLVYTSPSVSSISDFNETRIDPYFGHYKIWNEANDGSGSGLDADLLDGIQATGFVNQNGTYTLASGYSVAQGDWGLRNTTPSGWIQFGPANSTWAHIYSSGLNFYFNNNLYVLGNLVWNASNDGSGSGLDADLLDGHDGSYYATASSLAGYMKDGGTTAISNINTIGTESIKHRWNNTTTGRPASAQSNEYGTVTTLTYDSAYATQLAWDIDQGNLYGRTLNLSTDSGSWVKFWHEGNDGSGSGLDADLLDGQHGSYYAPASSLSNYVLKAGDTMTGHLTVQYNGVTTTPGYTQGQVELYTNSNYVPALGFHRAGYSATTLYENDGQLYVNPWVTRAQAGLLLSTGNIGSYAWTSINDGSGSGLDADTVDGLHASQFLRSDTADTMSGAINFDNEVGRAEDKAYIEFYVHGSSESTYYPVVILGAAEGYAYKDYSISRRYNWTAPTSWNNATHPGGLTLTWQHSGDTAWGGNDKEWRVIQFDETYTQVCQGLDLATTGGMVVWLRGGGSGGARYRLHSPLGRQASVTIYDGTTSGYSGAGTHASSTTFTSGSGVNYNAESANTTTRDNRINPRWPVRDRGYLYHNGNGVWHTANDGSGSGLDADLLDGVHASGFVQTTNNSSLNSDSRNTRGVTRLYRRDDNSDFSVQTYWTGSHWFLRGYNGDSFHAECRVDYADSSATASYATTAGSASEIDGWGFTNTGSNSGVNANTINSNGISYYTAGVDNFSGNSTDGALYSQRYSDSWQHQIAGDYRSGQIALRGRNNGTWQPWRKVWDVSNDGSGSGLDADLLDGKDHTNFGATLATYGTTGGSSGRIRCTAPFNTNSAHMFQVTVSIYSSYTIHTYVVGGYMYPTTNQWHSPTVIYSGGGSPDIVVGRDSNGKAYISIANGNYTGVRVHNMTLGYQTVLADTYDPWTITIDGATENSVTPTVHKVWTSVNDGSGSGLDADLWDGNQFSSYLNQAVTTGSNPTFNTVQSPGANADVRFSVWSGTTYGIGMTSGVTYGGLNDYAMTFCMNNDSDRGFWWGYNGQAKSTGAMSLTTAGVLTVASTITSGGSIAVGSSLNSWNSSSTVAQVGSGTVIEDRVFNASIVGSFIGSNYYRDTSGNHKALIYGATPIFTMSNSGNFIWYTSSSVSAGATATLTEVMQLTQAGNLTVSGNITAYSDRRIKDNILPITDALHKVQKLNGTTYNRTDTTDKESRFAGLIAQDVETVLPEAVTDLAEKDIKSLDYSGVVALLVEAVKELKAEVDDLKSQLKEK